MQISKTDNMFFPDKDSIFVQDDNSLPYPRVCAHRGFNTIAPENSLPAYGAAVALGAKEIEFDLWNTLDGELVSIHDSRLERVSNGQGIVWEHTYDELRQLDFGIKYGEHFRNLKILTFEDILKRFARTTIMNIHVKIWDKDMAECYYERISGLIRRYHCQSHVYMMSISERCLSEFHKIAPEINRCIAFNCVKSNPIEMIDQAKRLGLQKIQISDPTREVIEYAHQNGLICNIFYADSAEKATEYIIMGADTILTNNYLTVANAIYSYDEEHRRKHMTGLEG